jgi:hypothetical protein
MIMMGDMRWVIVLMALVSSALAQDVVLRQQLESVYGFWRNAMVQKNYASWAKVTAEHRQVTVRNRLNSERRIFPQGIFELPAAPPALTNLQHLQTKRNGRTAKSVYYGKVDFNVGGQPTDNLLVVDYVQERTGWKYDQAQFVSLAALPEVRKELSKGDFQYITATPDFSPTGQVPPVPMAMPVAKYIAKVYVFCPGREVEVTVNRVSKHRFGNAKEAELVMGGVRDGSNHIRYSVKGLPGAKGNEALAIRVYVFSQIRGVKPLKICEYQVLEGETVKGAGEMNFEFDAKMAAILQGK